MYQLQSSSKMKPIFHFIFLLFVLSTLPLSGKTLSSPIAIVDPSYTTGTTVLITTSWANTSATNFLVNYQTIMSTNSLNATLGIMGINYIIIGTQWGFRMSIASITSSSLNILLNVKDSNNPIYYLRICYFVTYNSLLDVNWVSYSFGSTDPIANYTLTPGTCFFNCRVYTTTQAFRPKTAGTIISTLSGFEVNNNPQPPNSTTYFGITLEPRQPSNSTTASSFTMNVTVYGGAEVTFVSYFYISFEANTINIINYRQATYGYSKAIGCYYTNYCNPQTISKLGHTTLPTQVLSYSQNNYFIGFNRMIMTWAGDNSTTAEFNISAILQFPNTTIVNGFSFTGNPNKQFQVALSYFTMQTFYCSTIGSDIYYVYNNNSCDSSCNGGIQQYANASNFCLPCGTYCWTCFGAANNCTGCYNNQSRVLLGNICVCDTAGGVFDDGSSVVCPVCHYSCKTCNGGGASFCLSCDGSAFRNLSTNSCPCMIGYYDSGGTVCQACHYTCKTATCNINTNVGCQSCNLTKNRVLLLNFTCGCTNGYYDNSTTAEECAACHYSCLTCWGTNKFCTSCSSANNRYINTTDNTCRCNTGYFDNGVVSCATCHPTCYTCNGALASNCLTCNPVLLRSLAGTTCACNVRYYDSSNTCLSCSYTCYTCLSSANNNCTACNSAAYRTINSTSSSCPCQSGYYDNGIQLCSPCSPSCLTCISSANSCTSCHNNTGRYYSGSGYSCLCSSGYIDVTFNGYCTACSYACLTCSTSPTNCNSCSGNRIWNGGLCTCPDGTYDNGISPTCLPCASTCATCSSGLSTSCTSCNSTLLRYLSISPTGACICSTSYYDSGLLMCQPCSSSCSACWGSATNCTACDSVTNRRIISSVNTCVCISGYVDVGGAACLACLSSCLTCSFLPNNCTSCSSDRTLASGVCSCKNGTFQNASLFCEACSYSCATCFSSSLTCLTCPIGSNRVLLASSCPCTAGFMETGTSSCAPCSYTCGSCNILANLCMSCPFNSFRTLNSASACPCNDGYYDNGGSSICLPCSKTCLTCTYYSLCITCNSTHNRVLDSINQACVCISGYYESGNAVCSTCHYSCTSCSGSGSSKCITCQTGRTISLSSCPCSSGTYDSNGTCTSCALSCKTCEGTATNCTSCATGGYLLNGKCLCNMGYYFNGNLCTQCDSSCQACSITSTNCIACKSAQGKVLNGTICQCPSNKYYNTSVFSCLSCDVSCLSCDGGSKYKCLTCNSLTFRNFNSGLSSCDCLSNYYDNGSSFCQKCTSPCLTCNGGSILNCTSCIIGFTLIGSSCTNTAIICPNFVYQGMCINACPNTTFPSGSSCLTCINNCLTCATSTYCYSCTSNYFLFNNTCLLSCPTNSYLNSLDSRICNSCPISCLQCTIYQKELICLSCVSSYYLLDYYCTLSCPSDGTHVAVGQNCYPCLSPCSTCTAISSNGCTSCNKEYSLFNGMCLVFCPEGYLSINSVCISCPQNCSSCRENQCFSCSFGFYLTLDGQCCALDYYFSNGVKVKCHPNCLSCTDSSFSSCISCVQYRGDASEMAISGYCDCWKHSIDLGDGKCDIVSYEHLQEFNQFLVTLTTSVNYLSVLSGVISMNFFAFAMNIFYQQTYSNFYFVNSSAVLQTDAVLGRFGDTSITKFAKSLSQSSAPRQQYGRRLADYSQSHLQDDQSLFMRGSAFEYSIDQIKIVVILTGCLWALVIVLKCILAGLKSKTTNRYIVINTTLHFMNQSAIILLLFFTINEVALYSLASIIIAFKKYSHQIDYSKLIPSILFLVYNLLYLTKLFYVSLKRQLSRDDYKRHKILYAFFEGSKLNLRRCRIYVPLLLLRSLLLSISIVSFSYSSQTQVISSLIIIILWDIYSFVSCPYAFYVRFFIRIHQILFTVQISLLAISVSNPEGSRLGVAKCILAFNFLQVLVFIGLSLSVLFDRIHNIKCMRREQNTVTPSNSGLQQTKAQIKENSMIEQTVEGLNEKPNIQSINKSIFYSNNSIMPQDASKEKQQASILMEEIIRKRYRVKRDKGQ